jgi:hypothetical protein
MTRRVQARHRDRRERAFLGHSGADAAMFAPIIRPRPCRRITRERGRHRKKRRCRGTAKFREETSKKADKSVSDRFAAMHNLSRTAFLATPVSHRSEIYSLAMTGKKKAVPQHRQV